VRFIVSLIVTGNSWEFLAYTKLTESLFVMNDIVVIIVLVVVVEKEKY